MKNEGLVQKIYANIQRDHLFKSKDKVLVGVSGGPDSVALLLILNLLKQKLGIKIFVAHLNHGLRKIASEEEFFVRKLSARLRLPAIVKRVKIDKEGSLEENARNVRYNFFLNAAKLCGANKIALAHTKDDQAETVLMRLLRGSGLSGLGAIPKLRQLGDSQIVRPLLEFSKNEILQFLKKKRQEFYVDESNLEDVYFRNRIRHQLLPQLLKFSPNLKELLSKTADNLSWDYDFLKEEAQLRLKKVIVSQNNLRIVLSLNKLLRQHLAMQRMIIRLAISQLCQGTRQLTYKHWQEIEALIGGRPFGAIVNLPKSLSVKKIPTGIILSVRKS